MLRAHEIDLIFLVAPTSTDERLRMWQNGQRLHLCRPLRTGVTGTQAEMSLNPRSS